MVRPALHILWDEQLAGRLWLDEASRFVFQYEADWKRPLSLSLPIQREAFDPDQARPFFANLLPEAGVRQAIAEREKISETNDFELLKRLGGDCAGAIWLWPSPRKLPPASLSPTTEKELAARVSRRSGEPLLLTDTDTGVRMSLAGAHEKVPLVVDGEDLFFPKGSASSSHILKAPDPRWHNLVENEALCMRLAAAADLRVAPVRILPRIPALLIERYDRIPTANNKKIRRLHQEDLCQALGVMPEGKYETEGGPGFVECFAIFGGVGAEPAVDRKRILEWAIFNVLIGNADAHGKNLSILYADDGIALAPLYDLICTRMYRATNDRVAMRYGGHDRFDVGATHWRAFAKDAGLTVRLVSDVLRSLAEALPELLGEARASLELSRRATEALGPIQEIIVRQCRRAQRVAKLLRD